ncbi:uncharacterized protein LOC136075023 isoform X2 [Hydra vulgaris]|uniref:Uncharacterized protein LOC136075023 isoform X2 n=1 Tax=Hydra vulgaris TaxID=6087 RepID=A0ABM4B3A8_HYDVU
MSSYSSEGASNTGNDNQFLLTSKIVGRVGYFIGGKFDSFGRHLNLSQYDVSNIKTDENTAQAKAVAVIDMWIEHNGISKWEQLKIELLSFGHKNTVEIIEKEFLINRKRSKQKKRKKKEEKERKKDSSNPPNIASRVHVKNDISAVCTKFKLN